MQQTNWNRFAPWFLTIACTIALIIIGYFLVKNINWYKDSVFEPGLEAAEDPEYRFYAYHIHLSMIMRSIGLFSGFAIMFLGLGVAFFTLKNNTNIDASGGGFSAKIVTASPGIIALLVGAYLIIATIKSKSEFPLFKERPKTSIDSTKRPPVPD